VERGGRHAVGYGSEPGCPNLGYIVDDRLYHPGDLLHVPRQPIETLLIPMYATWLKTVAALSA
jgi:hypothetical protein